MNPKFFDLQAPCSITIKLPRSRKKIVTKGEIGIDPERLQLIASFVAPPEAVGLISMDAMVDVELDPSVKPTFKLKQRTWALSSIERKSMCDLAMVRIGLNSYVRWQGGWRDTPEAAARCHLGSSMATALKHFESHKLSPSHG